MSVDTMFRNEFGFGNNTFFGLGVNEGSWCFTFGGLVLETLWRNSTVFEREERSMLYLTTGSTLELDLPNCWHLYKLLIHIYILIFCLPLDHLYSTGKPWLPQKQLRSTTQGISWCFGAEKMEFHVKGGRNQFPWPALCTDHRGTWFGNTRQW